MAEFVSNLGGDFLDGDNYDSGDTWGVTVPTEPNAALVLSLHAVASATFLNINTTVTYESAAPDILLVANNADGAREHRIVLAIWLDPPTGAGSGAFSFANTANWSWRADLYRNVSQSTTPKDSNNTNGAGSATSASVTVDAAEDDLVLSAFGLRRDRGIASVNSPHAGLGAVPDGTATGGIGTGRINASHGPGDAGGTQTVTWSSWSSDGAYGLQVVTLESAEAADSPLNHELTISRAVGV
jgi:hypothetical protein